MKQAYLWIAGIVSTAAVAGGSIAVMQSPPAQLPQPDPVALSPSTSTEAPVKNNSASSDNTPAETSPNPPQPDPKLSDFPHRRLELSDEVSAGSEFDQFRDRLQKAIKDRDADFIRALIPPEGLFYGFGGL
ncbi:MAG: hypothetical protein HC886_19575 [Leptolyngbyaceae cyanobacterium SM1_1_3]|nr:hypothetical protein [Leptolyngbyaceae cyanobacterium SM1_1_3]